MCTEGAKVAGVFPAHLHICVSAQIKAWNRGLDAVDGDEPLSLRINVGSMFLFIFD